MEGIEVRKDIKAKEAIEATEALEAKEATEARKALEQGIQSLKEEIFSQKGRTGKIMVYS